MVDAESEGTVAFDLLRGGGGEMRYLVVIRVCGVSGQSFGPVGGNFR